MYPTTYPRLRASLAPEYAELDDAQLDALVAEIYGPGIAAADIESFWGDLGRGFQKVARGVGKVASKAAPVIAGALPSIAQGALTGATVAGPWGALAGAVAGGAGGIMAQSKNRTVRSIGGAIGGATQLAGSLTGGGGALRNLAGVGLGGGTANAISQIVGGALRMLPPTQTRQVARKVVQRSAQRVVRPLARQAATAARPLVRQAAATARPVVGGAVQQLSGALGGLAGNSANAMLGMLARPETMRALSASALGQFGRKQIPLGGQAVPVQSILGALGTLAEHAAAEAESTSQTYPAHWYGADGELAIDPADAEQRTEALLELYAATPTPYAEWLITEAAEFAEAVEAEYQTAYEAEYQEDEYDEDIGPGGYTAEDAENDEWLLASEAAEEDDDEGQGWAEQAAEYAWAQQAGEHAYREHHHE